VFHIQVCVNSEIFIKNSVFFLLFIYFFLFFLLSIIIFERHPKNSTQEDSSLLWLKFPPKKCQECKLAKFAIRNCSRNSLFANALFFAHWEKWRRENYFCILEKNKNLETCFSFVIHCWPIRARECDTFKITNK